MNIEKSPLHHSTWLKQLIEHLKTEDLPVNRLLTEAGISAKALKAENSRLPFGQIAAFFELAAQATGDDHLGFHFGRSRDPRDFGLLGYVGLASPTLQAALHNTSRYSRIISDAVALDLATVKETGLVHWDIRLRPDFHRRQYHEFSVTNIVHALRAFSGRDFTPERVAFVHPRNTETREFDRFFGCRVEFGAPRSLIQLKRSDLALHLMTSDDRLLKVLLTYCNEVLGRHSDKPVELIERVERAIVDRLTSGEAKLEVVAAELGMSKRTLSRRLAEENTSFNDMVDVLRCELAKSYLRDSRLSLTEIAFLLGYSEVSSFNTAFKRWTGRTPGQARNLKEPVGLLAAEGLEALGLSH